MWHQPNQSVSMLNPSFKLFWKLPSNLHPLLQQKQPQPSRLPAFQLPLQMVFRFLISFLPSNQKQVPLPAGRSLLQSPSYLQKQEYQFITPLPCFLSKNHSPSYQFPEAYLILPAPCLRPLSNSPSQTAPFEKVSVPFPCLRPSFQNPLQLERSTAQEYSPKPSLLPARTSPEQQLPSGQQSFPLPVTLFFWNSPSYFSPVFHWYAPWPLMSPFSNVPLQVLPLRYSTAPEPWRNLQQILLCVLLATSQSHLAQYLIARSSGRILSSIQISIVIIEYYNQSSSCVLKVGRGKAYSNELRKSSPEVIILGSLVDLNLL